LFVGNQDKLLTKVIHKVVAHNNLIIKIGILIIFKSYLSLEHFQFVQRINFNRSHSSFIIKANQFFRRGHIAAIAASIRYTIKVKNFFCCLDIPNLYNPININGCYQLIFNINTQANRIHPRWTSDKQRSELLFEVVKINSLHRSDYPLHKSVKIIGSYLSIFRIQ